MATADTVDMGPPHAPKEDAIAAFQTIEHELKRKLVHLRHEANKHEPGYFQAVAKLDDGRLVSFQVGDLVEVRLALSAYGKHLLGKVVLPEAEGRCFMFRAFVAGGPETATLHCVRMDEVEGEGGGKVFKAIFDKGDELVWFDE